MKQNWKPGTLVYPLPAALVSCAHNGRSNLITVAWTGTICTNPAMLYISVRPERFSYALIKESMEFTLNMFIAEVMNVLADEAYMDTDTGKFDLERAGLLSYSHGAYYEQGAKIGTFGFSVRKKK